MAPSAGTAHATAAGRGARAGGRAHARPRRRAPPRPSAVALAAALVEMTAKSDESILAQARLACAPMALRTRDAGAAPTSSATVYEAVLEGARRWTAIIPQREEQRLASALAAACVAGAGDRRRRRAGGVRWRPSRRRMGNPALIGDAVTAAELARRGDAQRRLAHLVRMNLV